MLLCCSGLGSKSKSCAWELVERMYNAIIQVTWRARVDIRADLVCAHLALKYKIAEG